MGFPVLMRNTSGGDNPLKRLAELAFHPPGDVMTVEITKRAVNRLLRLLEQQGFGRRHSSSITTSEPFSLISASAAENIEQDTNFRPYKNRDSFPEITKEGFIPLPTLGEGL